MFNTKCLATLSTETTGIGHTLLLLISSVWSFFSYLCLCLHNHCLHHKIPDEKVLYNLHLNQYFLLPVTSLDHLHLITMTTSCLHYDLQKYSFFFNIGCFGRIDRSRLIYFTVQAGGRVHGVQKTSSKPPRANL